MWWWPEIADSRSSGGQKSLIHGVEAEAARFCEFRVSLMCESAEEEREGEREGRERVCRFFGDIPNFDFKIL